jgi:hypothetical protein
MTSIQLPYGGWKPRQYQMEAWNYFENGGRHAELIWHRRSGKDELALHMTACAAFKRTGSYWHMLPEAAQARKAIWEMVNPHTGRRRIDEAFPLELRAATRTQEMQIVFKNGSSWQLVGSDNFNSLVGSSPAGIVYSEWALANPSSRAYLRPIIAENDGWQMFITTPRGKNHAYKTYQSALKDPMSFAQKLSAFDTGALTPARLAIERQAYIDDYGQDQGTALFEQEYGCSFEAALLGAFYGGEFRQLEDAGRICKVDYDPAFLVNTAWDLGRTDDTSIWFYQVICGEIRIIDFHSSNLKDLPFYFDLINGKGYKYGKHWLPHDAKAKTLASGGKSIQEQFWAKFGNNNVRIVPDLSIQDGIQASRAALKKCWFDDGKTTDGTEALKQYQREWDDNKKMFRDTPKHDWTSHPADAFRMLAIAWSEEYKTKENTTILYPQHRTIDQMIANQRSKRYED